MSTGVFPSNFIIWFSIQWQKAIDNNISEWNLVKIYMYDEKLFQCSYTKSKFPEMFRKLEKPSPKYFSKKKQKQSWTRCIQIFVVKPCVIPGGLPSLGNGYSHIVWVGVCCWVCESPTLLLD